MLWSIDSCRQRWVVAGVGEVVRGTRLEQELVTIEMDSLVLEKDSAAIEAPESTINSGPLVHRQLTKTGSDIGSLAASTDFPFDDSRTKGSVAGMSASPQGAATAMPTAPAGQHQRPDPALRAPDRQRRPPARALMRKSQKSTQLP